MALVALQDATTSAVTVPAVLTIFEIVTPLDGFALVTVTTTPPGPLSVSLTVAMVEFEEGEPCCRVTPAAAVIDGAVFGTVNVKVASVMRPQLSVARIVIVCVPVGAALLIETIPVTLSTEIRSGIGPRRLHRDSGNTSVISSGRSPD